MRKPRRENFRWKTAKGFLVMGEDGSPRYEHRAVMDRILGRRLERGEIVKHRNGDVFDNRPENLVIIRQPAPRRWVECACGCGLRLRERDRDGRKHQYLPSHHMRVPAIQRKVTAAGKPYRARRRAEAEVRRCEKAS